MKHRIKLAAVLLLCLGTIFLSGCWDQKLFENIGFALQLGLENGDKGEFLLSLTLPVVEEEIEQKIEILSTKTHLLREGREKMRSKSGKRVEGGKVQQIHFSKELAQKGVDDLLDAFLRSPENPLLANITVVDGSPLEMFEFSLGYKDKTRIAFYISDLIDDARKRTMAPETRIYDFNLLIHSGTIDPTAVYLRYDKKAVEVVGTALFNGARMVGDIGVVETGLLHALMNKKVNFEYVYSDSEEANNDSVKSGAAILFKNVKRKVKITIEDNKPRFDISLNLKSTLDEFDLKHHMDDAENEKKLEEAVAESVKKDCLKLLKLLQEIGSDPIGFGEMVRVKYNAFYKSVDWDEVYKNSIFNVDAKVDIEFYGAIT